MRGLAVKMKVRVRSANGGDTHKIEVPLPGSLKTLKEALAQKLSISSSSIRVSLNKKDELQGPSDALLSSFGITSGDLVFYTLNPEGFSGNPISGNNTEAAKRGRDAEQTIQCRRELCAAAAIKRASVSKDVSSQTEIAVPAQEEHPQEPPPPHVGVASVEIDEEIVPGKSRSVPFFLERVLSEERGNAKGSHGLLIIAVHAALLESGFVGTDGTVMASRDRFGLPAGWATKGTVSLSYTLPELVGVSAESAVFKFQTLGKFLAVYGCLLNGNGSQIYRLSLEVAKFLPAPRHAAHSVGRACSWENFSVKKSGLVGESKQEEKDGCSSWHESNVLELWKIVKDRLSLPVLTALCEKAGLPPPPSLVVLPTELKLKVLEFLPALDVAKMGCVCTEFRFLSANDGLWKQKFDEEFGSPAGTDSTHGARRWKDAFARAWIEKKRLAERRRTMERTFWPLPLPVRRFPSPFAGPGFGISGGDYDRFPAIGGGSMLGGHPLGGYGGRHGFLSRPSVVPDCDLGGLRGEFGGRRDQGSGHSLEPDFDFGEG